LLITSAGLLLAMSSFAPAFATQPTTLVATFTYVVTPTSVSYAGGNTFESFTDVITIAGGAIGTVDCAGTLVIHADGSDNYNCSGTFSGTVTGGSGPGTASVSFAGNGAGASSTANEVWGSGTGGLTGLHAQITVVATLTSGTKTMQVHFDP
jgi:hypothetical protein